VGKPSAVASPLADRGILHLPWVSFFRQNIGWSLVCSSLISFEFPHLHPFLLLAGLISGKHECAGAVDGVVLGVGGGKCCCVGVCPRGC
jgi:hypothetical protein